MKKIILVLLAAALVLAASCSEKPGKNSSKAEKEDVARTYILHVTDQNQDPVPEAYINFCTDQLCVPVASDENGTAVFDGDPGVYHVQLFKVPEGYSFDQDFELNVGPEYGEWEIRVNKD